MRPQDAIAAAKAFREAVRGNVVSDAEILRRAAICAACPKRQKVTGWKSEVSKKLGMIANKNRVPSKVSDYRCGVCGCSLMLLLPATSKDLHKDSPEEAKNRPKTCWLTAEVKNG